MQALETHLRATAELATTVWLWSLAAVLAAGLFALVGGIVNTLFFIVVGVAWFAWSSLAMARLAQELVDAWQFVTKFRVT